MTAPLLGCGGVRDRDACGQLGVAHDDLLVDDEAGAVGGPVEVVEEERRDVLAGHVAGGGEAQPLLEDPVVHVGVELLVLGQRMRDDERGRDVQRARAPA